MICRIKILCCLGFFAPFLFFFVFAAPPLHAQQMEGHRLPPRGVTGGSVQMMVLLGAFLRVDLAKGTKTSKLKVGSECDGEVVNPVYVVDRLVIRKGTKIYGVTNF